MKGIIITLLVGSTLFLGLLVASRGHWWVKLRHAKIAYGNQSAAQSFVYRSWDGDILLNLQEYGDELYIIRHDVNSNSYSIGLPNSPNFHFFAGVALSENAPELTVPMGGIKVDVPPNLVVEEHSIQFTSCSKVRVKIDLYD